MKAPVETDELLEIHRELVTRNGIEDGLIYLQVTRGAADRDFAYPSEDTEPTMVLFTQSKPGLAESPVAQRGIKVISIEDQRWGRRDIKTVQLLYPSMGKMMAKAAGCDDAWMVEDGHVTEGTSNNAYIVKGNTIVTRHLGTEILHGITGPPCCALPARRRCGWRSGPSPSTRRRRPTRPSSPRPRPS
jgi:D-alanine transaminase